MSYRVENIVGKGEIAGYKQFLLFSQCFPLLYIFSVSNVALFGCFLNVFQIVSAAFAEESNNTGREKLLLSVAVGVHPIRVAESYDVPTINRYFCGL